MRLLLQRVSRAAVAVKGENVAAIGPGLLVLAGFGPGDTQTDPGTPAWNRLVDKTLGLRIFPDADDRLNLSLADYGGELLAVSQFTLYADCRKGRRPSFSRAAPPETAAPLFDALAEDFERRLPGKVARGVFGAMMDVSLVNWGPVTIGLDSEDFAGG